MNRQKLWQQMLDRGWVDGQSPAVTTPAEQPPWYARILQGFAGWLAALFLLGFLGFGVAGLFDYGGVLIFMGLLLNGSAYVFFKKNPDNDFFEQLVLVFSLTGQFLFAYGLFRFVPFEEGRWFVVLGLYQIILVWLMNNYLHRFLSTWFAVIALFWGFETLIYSGLGSALVAALFVWLWLHKTGWHSARQFYEPIAYALGFALLQLNAQSQVWLYDAFYYRGTSEWLLQNSAWLSALLNSVVLLYFVYRIAVEQQLNWRSTMGRLVLLAAVVMLFSALPVMGLSSALLVLLVGFARQSRLLQVMGALAMLGFVGWYYHALNITLLYKSVIMVVTGVVLLLGYLLLRHNCQVPAATASTSQSATKQSIGRAWSGQRWAVGLTLLLALVGVNHAIWQKERLLDEGQSVLLALAPVDPRSIMQGDYMRLRFAIANDIRDSRQATDAADQAGFVVVKLDAQGVGQFHALATEDSEQLPGLLKMQYRIRSNRVQFATNAFFFQEGDAQLFDAARFGEFKVAANGEMLLKAMYDKDLKLLGENRLD